MDGGQARGASLGREGQEADAESRVTPYQGQFCDEAHRIVGVLYSTTADKSV